MRVHPRPVKPIERRIPARMVVKEISVYVGDLNLDVSGSGFTSCRYGTISTTKTYNPPKKKKSGAKKLLEKIFGN